MEAYQNKSGVSGVVAYEIGTDFIKVKFQGNNYVYLYNCQASGAAQLKQ